MKTNLVLGLVLGLSLSHFSAAAENMDTHAEKSPKTEIPQALRPTLVDAESLELLRKRIPRLPDSLKLDAIGEIRMQKTGGVIDGGGGNPTGLSFRHEAAKGLAILQSHLPEASIKVLTQALERATIIVTEDPLATPDGQGGVQVAAAVNQPQAGVIYVHHESWQRLSSAEKRALATHEVASLVGLEGTGDYLMSSMVLDATMVQPILDPKEVTLFEAYYDRSTQGFSPHSARQRCNLTKERFKRTYELVYCSYLQKSERVWNQYDRRYEEVPLDLYGLKVAGLGEKSTLIWKTVFSSKGYGPGNALVDLYPTKEDAHSACMSLLRDMLPYEPLWTKPRCNIQPDANHFYFEIQTQNPLVEN